MCYKPKANIFFMISIVYYVCKVKSNIFYYITKYGFQRKYGRFVHMCLAFVINHDYHIYARVMVLVIFLCKVRFQIIIQFFGME